MRTLFIKIFLWFWLAITLASIANFIQAITLPRGPATTFRSNLAVDRQQMLGQMLVLYAQGFPAIYEQQEKTTLDPEYAADPPYGVRTSLFSADGRQFLAGNPPLPAVREVALRAALSGTAQSLNRDNMLAMARKVSGPTGGSYIAAAGTPAMPPWAEAPRWITLSRLHIFRLVVSLVIGGIVCYILAWRLTEPVQKLRTAAQRLANGDLSARVGMTPGKQGGEVADLGRDLDRMAERIESLAEAQKRLFRDISHELRSPLARLIVSLELARKQGTPAAAGYLDRIEGEAERLNDLIGQLLTLAILEGGNEQLAREPVDLDELVTEVADDANFEAEGRNRTVRVIASEPLRISGNWEMLRRAFENVVRNAIRYTDEGTEVEISLASLHEETATYAVLSVCDHGPGVPEAALGALFRPFYRVADARDRQSGGTGIGLAIAERALHLHDGTVTARNAPGGGLLVEIRVPLILR
jgi:two-component system sensor histidine kinase CpxA